MSNDYDELYHANGDSNGYDNFDQVTDFRRGPLSDASDPADNIPDTVTKSSRTQGWDFDALGNWETLTTDGNDEDREHNRQNQVTVVGGNAVGFDNNGNMIEDQTGKGLVYDAWNRLVQVKTTPTGTQIRAYAYDALDRRVAEANGTFRQFYYSDQWQVLEEHHWGELVAQYVWSPVYVDALVLRDRDTDANGSLDERLYVQQDANWNVTAVANPSGTTVHERYVYDAYGTPTRLSGSWGTPGTDLNMVYLHQGGRWESATGLYHFRMRDYSAALGRWVEVDPIGFAAGDTNFYRYVFNAPTIGIDPSGLALPKGIEVRPRPGQQPPPPPNPQLQIEAERIQADVIANYERMCQRELASWVRIMADVSGQVRIGVSGHEPLRRGPSS